MGCGPGHVAGYLHESGVNVFGLDISPRMIEEARKLNSGIRFKEGDMMSLKLPDDSLAGVVAFYSICNIPRGSLPTVFQEMRRVLKQGGLLLLAFHVGNEILHEDELWGRPISMDFFLYQSSIIRRYLGEAGFVTEEIVERRPYPPDVEYQSRRAYVFARKSDTSNTEK